MTVITLVMLGTLAVSWTVSGGGSSSFGSRVGALDRTKVPNGWAHLIEDAADESGVPAPVLAAQIETESSWRPEARSSAGTRGLSQFMPGTWDAYGRGGDPHNPADAIAAQGRYIRKVRERTAAYEQS